MPHVSIVTRTKDRPLYLERAARSVLGQTFADWELIVVNDGGDPAAVESALAAVADADPARVRIIHHETSRGRWQSANEGVRAAQGSLIVLHDDDDSWHPDFLRRGVDHLAAHPDRAGVVSRIMIVWEERRGAEIVPLRTEVFLPDSVAPLLMDQVRFNHFVPIAFLYRRSLHDKIGLYDEDFPVIADWRFNTRVLTDGVLEYLGDEPLAYWHQRASGEGADGNSVIAAHSDHALYDALLRDDAFRSVYREDVRAAALYFERRIRAVEEMIKAQNEMLLHQLRSPVTVAMRRVIDRVRRRRRPAEPK